MLACVSRQTDSICQGALPFSLVALVTDRIPAEALKYSTWSPFTRSTPKRLRYSAERVKSRLGGGFASSVITDWSDEDMAPHVPIGKRYLQATTGGRT